MGRSQQLRLSLALLSAMIVTSVAVVVLAHATPIIQNHVDRELALHKSTKGYFLYDNGYTDDGDYLFLSRLPDANYSRGGVYFIGASEMNTAIMTWTLPEGERRLIHNYAVGDMRHSDARQFLRMLVEDSGLLQAGGNKTTVVLGLSYQMVRPRGPYVKQLVQRHRHYTHDWEDGMRRVQITALERFVRVERDRANRYLRAALLPQSRIATRPQAYSAKLTHLARVMGDDWRTRMAAEVGELEAQIDYLQKRQVRVQAVLHPSGSWHNALPYEAAYRDLVLPMLRSRGVPASDYRTLLSDDEFVDSVHAFYPGQLKLHAAYHALALKALADMGTRIEP